MKLRRRPVSSRALILVVAILLVGDWLTAPHGQGQEAKRRIAVFGSSVANGTGDELGKEGYTGRLREMLVPRGWEVLNQSRGGDNTRTMAPRFAPEGAPQPNVRYLLPVNPNYVLLGLSLGNEGIKNGTTAAEKDAIYKQFEAGMHGFVDRSRENHIVPIITLCYTRNDFTDVEYEYTRRMNLLINTWDVPSVNFLGAVDDGTGKWAKGFWWDSLHPNASGHDELTDAFVPTLFDALEQGKPLPKKSTAAGFARVTGGAAPITFAPGDRMHPFAESFQVRARADGTVAAVSGATLVATTGIKQVERGAGRGPVDLEETTLAAGPPFTATVGVQRGAWTYTAANGTTIASTVKADAAWHQIVVSHYTARGETLFFVDGQLAGRTAERLEPTRFVVGGPGGGPRAGAPASAPADFKELMIYRSALNADEVAALAKGALLQASLEVYSPLADARFERDAPVENRAQATTFAKVGDGTIAHVGK
jgi:lysophospholipase L1-like esterase